MARKVTTKAENPDEALLEEINDRFKYCKARWEKIRTQGQTDMRYVAGDPWAAQDRLARELAGRPCLSFDEIGQYENQAINELKANKLAVKFSPTGNGATDETSDFYAAKWREIEYRSNGSDCYVNAAKDAIERSYGYIRLTTKRVSRKTFNQELWIEEFPNPDVVFPDPDAQDRTSKDMRYCFVVESRSHKEFTREFPNATIKNFDNTLIAANPSWLGQDRVQVAEYWTVETTQRELIELIGPNGDVLEMFMDELPDEQPPAGAKIGKRAMIEEPKVMQYLTNGVEILERNPWAGEYIPIVSCYGKILWVDQGSGPERVILSMTRLARDPYMAYCFYRTCEIENVGMTTKNPYMAYKGQFDAGQLTEIQKSLHQPVAALFANATTPETGSQILPLPQRNVSEPHIAALSQGAEECRRAIQAAMGLTPLPTSAQRRNEKSGIALKQIEESGQRGTYHFTDSYKAMIRQAGVIGEDLMDKILDNPREVDVMEEDGTPQKRWINDPSGQHKDALASIKGQHAVTISTGPDFASEREESSAFADLVVGSQPLMQLAGPNAPKLAALAIRLKGAGPIADQMADLFDPKQGPEMAPEQAQALIAQAKQGMAMAQQEIQQLQDVIKTDQIKGQIEIEKARMDAEVRLKIAEMTNGVKGSSVEMQVAGKSRDTDVQADVDIKIARMESQLKMLELAEKRRQDAASRQHEVGMAMVSHEQAEESAENAAAREPEAGV